MANGTGPGRKGHGPEMMAEMRRANSAKAAKARHEKWAAELALYGAKVEFPAEYDGLPKEQQ